MYSSACFRDPQDCPHVLFFARKTQGIWLYPPPKFIAGKGHKVGSKGQRQKVRSKGQRQEESVEIRAQAVVCFLSSEGTKVCYFLKRRKTWYHVAIFLPREVHSRLSTQGFYCGTGHIGPFCRATTKILDSGKEVGVQHKSHCFYAQ